MPDSIKCFIFSIVGFVVFGITAAFFPLMLFISTVFGIMAAVSISVFLFQKIKTKHHFLKSALSLLISSAFFGGMLVFSFMLNNDIASASLLEQLNYLICYYGMTFSAFLSIASFFIFIFDMILTVALQFIKDHDIVPIKLFRFTIYCTFIFGCIGTLPIIQEIVSISQLLAAFFCIFDIVMIFILIFGYTGRKFVPKTLATNVACLFLSVIAFYYYTFFESISLPIAVSFSSISSYLCALFIFLSILTIFILMLIEIFTPSTSFLDYFSALLYSAAGIAISGSLSYFGAWLPFMPQRMEDFFYISLISFVIGSAVSIMSIAFKMIFKGTKSSKVEKINIDIDE